MLLLLVLKAMRDSTASEGGRAQALDEFILQAGEAGEVGAEPVAIAF